MVIEKERNQITITDKAYERLNIARKKGESLSDVIIRLSEAKVAALQRRVEMELATSDNKRFVVQIDQDKMRKSRKLRFNRSRHIRSRCK